MPGYFADPALTREQRCARLWESFLRYLELTAYTAEDIAEVFTHRPGTDNAARHQRVVMRHKLMIKIDFVLLWGYDEGREALRCALKELRWAALAALAPEERDARIEERRMGRQPEPPVELITATECPVGLFVSEIRKRQVSLEQAFRAEVEAVGETQDGSPASPTGGKYEEIMGP